MPVLEQQVDAQVKQIDELTKELGECKSELEDAKKAQAGLYKEFEELNRSTLE